MNDQRSTARGRRPGRRRQLSPEDRGSRERAREAALGLLERCRRTRADLAERLKKRGFDADCIEEVLDRLAAVGLIDDRGFAEAFVRDRLRFRPRSRRFLAIELRRRGVDDATIEAAFDALGSEAADSDLAVGLLRRRSARLRRKPVEERRQRAIALLRRYGFTFEVIEMALARVSLADDG